MPNTDEYFMTMALELAAKARGRTSPNPMVGAVIVKDGKVIGTGYHKKAGTPHAEVYALREAGDTAKGATMYVTLEPCSHFGRTPPCSQAVIAAGLKRVVVAMEDPNPLVKGRGLQQLRDAGIAVKTGVLEAEAVRLNEIFIKYITTGTPFVLVKAAMTLDGKIAASSGDAKWVSGKNSRRLVHQWRDQYDAILVGVGTVLADDPLLTTRLDSGSGHNPVRIVMDSTGKIPLEAQMLRNTKEAPVIIVTTEKISPDSRRAYEKLGAEVFVAPEDNGKPDVQALLTELGRRQISSLLVEGGALINATFLRRGLVDKIAWFIAPKIIGGTEAPTPVADLGLVKMSAAIDIKDITVELSGEDILIQGYPDKTKKIEE